MVHWVLYATNEALNFASESGDVLYDVIWRLKAAADEHGLVFVHHFSSEEVMIEGDEKLLERAVSNIGSLSTVVGR